jgi:hypothetical protein
VRNTSSYYEVGAPVIHPYPNIPSSVENTSHLFDGNYTNITPRSLVIGPNVIDATYMFANLYNQIFLQNSGITFNIGKDSKINS